MKKYFMLVLVLFVAPVMSAGIHVDDVSYQEFVDKVTPNFTKLIEALEEAKNAADEVDTIDTGTLAQLCAKLFPTSGTTTCDTAGEEHYDITDSLQKLANRSDQLHNCASNGTCNASPRLEGLRKHTNETQGVELDATAAKYQPMFDAMNIKARKLLTALLETNIVNALVNEVISTKSDADLCNQFFAANEIRDCTSGGGTDKELNLTVDVKTATDAMEEMYDCATNVACGTGDRFTEMRQFWEIP